METKTFSAVETKVLDEAQGIVETVWTVFGVIDQGKDMAHPGMFTKTFAERGQKVKVLDMHRRDTVMAAIGKPLELRELPREQLPPKVLQDHPEATGGAYARIQFLMDTPEGKGAFIRLQNGVIDEWSYGYDPLDYDHETVKGNNGQDMTIRNLRTVKLYELGPVLWGMVPGTQTVSAKADNGPTEAKPVETTEKYVRVRVRAPGLFEEGSFRTITISADEGIRAVIGKLKGETTTTVQTYLFDNEKWDEERAKKWVKEHKKDWEGAIDVKTDDALLEEWLRRVAALEAKADNAPDGGPRSDMSEQQDVTVEAGPETPTSNERKLKALRKQVEIALLEVQNADNGREEG